MQNDGHPVDNISNIAVDNNPNQNNPKKNWLVYVLAVFSLLGFVSTTFFAYQYYQLKSKTNDNQPQPISTPTASPTTPRQNTTQSLDNIWNLYTNYKLGFSIKTPKVSEYYYGFCHWDKESDNVNDGKTIIPVKVYELDDSVYIDWEYYYKLIDSSNMNKVSNCMKADVNLSELKDKRHTWQIIVQKIGDESELTNFVKGRFGTACEIGEKTETNQNGVFDVRVKTDGKDFETSQCILNYGYVLKYDTNNEKLYTWDIGQEVKFFDDRYPELQNQMGDSFLTLP